MVTPAVRAGGTDHMLVPRIFTILGTFRDRPVQGVSEISRRSGVPRTTVHRIATQLAEEGALVRVGTGYRLGPILFELGTLHYPHRLRDAVDPFLVDLQRLTGGEVALCELTGRDVIVLHVIQGRRPRSTHLDLGARLPAHACAAGKVLLAHTRRFPYRAGETLWARTGATITDARALEAQLPAIRSARLAVEHGELIAGRLTVAAPLTNRHGRVLGALMVLLTDDADLAAISEALTAVARTLTAAGQSANIDFFARAHPTPAT